MFHNSNPIVLELGCGYGEYTVAMSRMFPEKNFIGVDIKGARIWRGAKTVTEEGIPNAAFLRTRIECISNIFSPGEISEIWITFPDPQLKRRRAPKRLTSPLFLERYAKILSDNGIIHLKTDSLHLYEYTRALLDENKIVPITQYSDIYSQCTDSQLLKIQTHYEALSLQFGVTIKYISWHLPVRTHFTAPDFYGDMEDGTLDDDRPKPGKRGMTVIPLKIDIDKDSGFCSGVVRAIAKAEEVISTEGSVACLGELVHNSAEVERLSNLGLTTISHDQIPETSSKILIRAHGEPPATFDYLDKLSHPYIDATCPVVKALQRKVRQKWEEMKTVDGQIVIFGKKGHAEVIGLAGQTDGEAIVVENESDLSSIDFKRPVSILSQTTQSVDDYNDICKKIRLLSQSTVDVSATICRSVAGRSSNLRAFAKSYDVIVFVAGHNSSNGKALFSQCKEENPNSYLVSSEDEIDMSWFKNCRTIGICGATSTPRYQMEEVKKMLGNRLS